MQYLVIFTPKKQFATEGMPSDFMDKEQQEQVQVRELYAGGGLRQVWAQVPRTNGGVVLFEAESSDQLQDMINSFPLIKAHYADPQIVPLQQHAAFLPPGRAKQDS
jgi:muconolactone delta-isomerase